MISREQVLRPRELLERYRRGERDFRFIEIEADPDDELSGVSLDGADFTGAFIAACFRGSSLAHARFVRANVKTCDFRNADLSDADFSGAALCATEFAGARLDRAQFEGAFAHSRQLKRGEQPDW